MNIEDHSWSPVTQAWTTEKIVMKIYERNVQGHMSRCFLKYLDRVTYLGNILVTKYLTAVASQWTTTV